MSNVNSRNNISVKNDSQQKTRHLG